MMVTAATPFTASNAKSQGIKHKAALCILALFTVIQVCFHLRVGRPDFHEDDEVECVGASLDTMQCYEARVFRQWHNSADGASDGRSGEVVATVELEKFEKPSTQAIALGNDTADSHMHILEALRVVAQVGTEELAATTVPAVSALPSKTSVSRIGFVEAVDEILNTDAWASDSDASSGDRDWATDLVDLQGRLETRMSSLKLLQKSQETIEHQSPEHEEHLSAWAQDLETLQERLQARGQQLKAKHEAHHQATTQAPSSTTNLVQEIWDYGRELCKDPRRRSYESCSHFFTGGDAAVSSAASAEMTSGDGSTPAPSSTSAALSLYDQQHHLHWHEVKSWRANVVIPALRGSGEGQAFAGVATEAFRHSGWGGMIPKVACVAVMPFGKEIRRQLAFFVETFKLQNYEGPKQLVLVYHHEDLSTKELLTPFADGVGVKMAASMGDRDAPSTQYRFGAWAAKDADVIARWDWDAFHHPFRLSMQIRAMAFAKLPGSRLSRWSTRRYLDGVVEPTSQLDILGEASLVGEKEWMSQYWFPMLLNEANSLSKVNSKHVVEFDSPELLVYTQQI